MIVYNIREMMAIRGISKPFTELVKAGITNQVAHQILNDQNYAIKLKHLTIVCRLLHCTPNDIMVWKEDQVPMANDHPLRTLKPIPIDVTIHDTLRTLPLSQIRDLAASILNNSSEKP